MQSCDTITPVPDNVPFPQRLPALRSNQGNYVGAASTGWMQSVTTDTPTEDTRARFDRDGYLWVKNLIPREDVLDMREQ